MEFIAKYISNILKVTGLNDKLYALTIMGFLACS